MDSKIKKGWSEVLMASFITEIYSFIAPTFLLQMQ